MRRVAVFGGGIAGLTAAHELLKKGFRVDLYEKLSSVGGMARSRREPGGVPSEASWRTVGPYYKNFMDVAAQIPRAAGGTILDDIAPTFSVHRFSDDAHDVDLAFDARDTLALSFLAAKVLVASGRKKAEYNATTIRDALERTRLVSDATRKIIMNYMVGPAWGMNPHNASFGRFFEVGTHMLTNSRHPAYLNSRDWRVFKRPTSEAWFAPWVEHLESHPHFALHLGCRLERLESEGDEEASVTSCVVETPGGRETVVADEYVLAINPFEAEAVLERSGRGRLAAMHHAVNHRSDNAQISFRFGFKKKIELPEKAVLNFFDSEFEVLIIPYEQHWDADVPLDDRGELKSLWSGTLVDCVRVVPGVGKSALQMTKAELFDEICRQMLRSRSFREVFFRANGYHLTRDDIDYHELWYEWTHDGSVQRQSNVKWGNTCFNANHQFGQGCGVPNLYFSGAHTRTSLGAYSMEAAVDSGKRAANLILDKHGEPRCYNHVSTDPLWLRALRRVDGAVDGVVRRLRGDALEPADARPQAQGA